MVYSRLIKNTSKYERPVFSAHNYMQCVLHIRLFPLPHIFQVPEGATRGVYARPSARIWPNQGPTSSSTESTRCRSGVGVEAQRRALRLPMSPTTRVNVPCPQRLSATKWTPRCAVVAVGASWSSCCWCRLAFSGL